jgi:crotonobetainyl-CoA:carnitine CoA-transferase CaiB-like acyl-CoA transferase
MLAQCLAGTRVLDLCQYIPGPVATQWLADLGAEVVKVEPPDGDPGRVSGPLDADGTTVFYKLVNRGKRVVRIDLKDERGRRLFEQLVTAADVLVEGYRPGVMARLGFGDDRLEQLNPRLIHCSLSGYGQTGPHAPRAGHDLTYQALAGTMAVSGPVERPAISMPPLADYSGAMLAAMAILAALHGRAASGKGARLDVSLSEGALSWMAPVYTIAERWGRPAREGGLITGAAAFYRVYRTRDGRFLAVAPLEPKFWANFCQAVGRPEWIPRQSDPMPQTALIDEVAALIAARDRDDWVALLAGVDCCVEPVLDPDEVVRHPHTRARGFVQATDDLVDVLLPVLMDGARPRDRRPHVEDDAAGIAASWRSR